MVYTSVCNELVIDFVNRREDVGVVNVHTSERESTCRPYLRIYRVTMTVYASRSAQKRHLLIGYINFLVICICW